MEKRQRGTEPKSQSAMEYLMTYGWAILAIAVVMVSLYSLGIFNTGNLQPTATPGSCEVVRTSAQTSLAGQCGNLIPKYVAKFVGSANVNMPASSSLHPPQKITVSMWIYFSGFNNMASPLYMGDSPFDYRMNMQSTSPYQSIYWQIFTGGVEDWTNSQDLTAGQWYLATGVYNGSGSYLYINGILVSSTSASGSITYSSSNDALVLSYSTLGGQNVQIADVQIYNTSLDNTTVKALYQEGIGGTPIDIQHVVGWWPLNGNANDYSGNNNQGTATNVIWNANWQSGYTAPAT